MPNLYIAIIHNPILNVRLNTVNNLIEKLSKAPSFKIKVQVMDMFNPEQITQQDIQKYVRLEKLQTNTIFDQLVSNLHIKQISAALKHYHALQNFLAQDQFDDLLVLEDDVIFSDDVVAQLERALDAWHARKGSSDMLLLGCPTPAQATADKEFVIDAFKHFNLVPSCDSYLTSKQAARKLFDAFLPIRFARTLHLSYLHATHDMRIDMTIPNIFVNGSKYGAYVSSIEANNRLFMNQEYNTLHRLVHQDALTSDDVNWALAILQNPKPIHDHPDFQYMIARVRTKLGPRGTQSAQEHLDDIKDMYEKALNMYKMNDAPIGNESEFLLNYIRLYGQTQAA